MLVVAALGGNALLRRGEELDHRTQERNVRAAARALAPIATHHRLVITHGNGPQVGILAQRSAAFDSGEPTPLDVLGAESEGMIGYLIEREMRSALPGAELATLLTQIEVDASDPALGKATKPIGPIYRQQDPEVRESAWTFRPERDGVRRVVPSPEPRRILEMSAIRALVDAGVIVLCAGGGGVPVVVDEGDRWRGLEAVIDKDRAAALLAAELRADALLLLTDVDGVYQNWGGDDARLLRHVKSRELAAIDLEGGSMAPKAEAAIRAVAAGVRFAAIGRLEEAERLLDWNTGTIVTVG